MTVGSGQPGTDRHRRLHLVHQHDLHTGAGVGAGTVAVGAGGIAHPSSDETLTSAGGSFKAVYSGDANYIGSTGDCEPLAASKLASSTATIIHLGTSVGEGTAASPRPSPAPIGSIVHDLATVIVGPGNPAPTGTVAFTWYTNTSCATGAPASAPGPWPWARAAIAHPSSDETLTSAGGSFKAVYSGDANYTGSTGDCEPLAASKLDELDRDHHPPRHRSRRGHRGPPRHHRAPIGSIVHDLATVIVGPGNPAPTGTVAFTWYTNTDLRTGAPASAPGPWPWARAAIAHPSSDETLTSTGGSFKAVYSGDANYTGSTGDCEPLTASKLESSTVTIIHLGTSVGERPRPSPRHHQRPDRLDRP